MGILCRKDKDHSQKYKIVDVEELKTKDHIPMAKDCNTVAKIKVINYQIILALVYVALVYMFLAN